MTILIDPPTWPAHGTLWSHLVSDESLGELHAFALRTQLPARGFDLDHYDVPVSRYDAATRAGAVSVTAHELVNRLRSSGLRITARQRRDRRHQRFVYSEPLLAQWLTLFDDVPTDHLNRAGYDLLAQWQKPYREYHNLTHLAEVLTALQTLDVAQASAPETYLAAFFHDAIHHGVAGEDEIGSANLARDMLHGLGFSTSQIDEVARLVTTTITHRPHSPADPARYLIDADLAILAAAEERYAAYARSIRAEYAMVSSPRFNAGRARILTGFLDRTQIFTTDAGVALWEEQARSNIARELASLI